MESRGFATILHTVAAAPTSWPARLAGLVLLPPPADDDGDPLSFLIDAFTTASAAEPLLASSGRERSVFATVSRLGGRFGLDEGGPSRNAALAAGLAGLAKTAAQEWPFVTCRTIDVNDGEDPRRTARFLANELLAASAQGRPLEIGLKDGAAVTTALQLTPFAVAQLREEPLLAPGDLVVVSGGARGVTAAVVQHLADVYQPALLILGRTAEPDPEAPHLAGLADDAALKAAILRVAGGRMTPRELKNAVARVLADREVRATLASLRMGGIKVLYRAVDIRDFAAVANAVSEARAAFGPVRLVMHGAGVLQDRFIKDKTRAQVELVLSTKLTGLDALMRATDPLALKGLVLFSSSTGRFGRKGQADYAVANDALNKLAQHYRATLPHCRVLSLNWGPWDGGMVTSELKNLFAAEGVAVISLDAGSAYLTRELQQGEGSAEIVVLGQGSRAPELSFPLTEPSTPSAAREAFQLTVSVAALPVLRDHVLGGRAVLPAALLLEYLALAASQRHAGLAIIGLDDFQVLKGVTLAADATMKLVATCGALTKRGDEFVCAVELRSGAQPHARATVVLAAAPTSPQVATIATETAAYSHSVADAYESILFHGPALRGLKEIRGLSATGATAVVAADAPPHIFHSEPLRATWITQPLALDCVFQLMILWSEAQLGARSLPASLRRFRQFGADISGICELRLKVRSSAPGRAIADCELLRLNGSVAARIEGFEATVEPALARAFQRNQLAEADAR